MVKEIFSKSAHRQRLTNDMNCLFGRIYLGFNYRWVSLKDFIKKLIIYQMQANQDKHFFHEETDSFVLTVALKDNELAITLKDLVEWIVYSKQYTKDQIGTQIHQKMDLFDIFTAFSQTKPSCDQERMKQREQSSAKLKKYQFGTLIENDKLPCYKIDIGGKITTYLVMFDKNRKEVVYESKLILNKERNLSELEIIYMKSTMQKKVLHKEIQKYKKEKEQLSDMIDNLQKENTQIKQELKLLHKELSQLIQGKQEQNQRILSLQKELSANKQETEGKICQLKNYIDRTQGKIFESRHQVAQQMKLFINQVKINLKQEFQARTKELKKDLALHDKKITSLIKDSIGQEISNQQNLPQIGLSIGSKNCTSLKQLNSSYFKVEGLKVQYIGDRIWTQYIFNYPIYQAQSAKFKLKITQAQYRYIMIGVVDEAKQRNQRCSYSSGNAMCYYAENGNKWPESTREGEGFKQGDTVQVDVDRAKSTIHYRVNGIIKATQVNKILADGSRTFMAYVEMAFINDSIEWLLE